MRVNARALLEVAGVGCVLDDPDGNPLPARLALVTEETVRSARDLGAADPSFRATDDSPQLRYGGALAYVDEGAGRPRRVVLAPGEGDAFRLPCGAPFLGRHMLSAERDLPEKGDGPLLRGLIRSLFALVASVPDPDRFPEHLIAQAYRSSLRDAFGDAHLPVGDEALVLKSRSDLIRSRIAALDPKHPDALGAASPLARILDGAGLDVRRDGVDIPGIGRITRFEARRLMEVGPYRSGLFERLTRTPPARIEGVVLPLGEARHLESSLSGAVRTGAWPDAIRAIAGELTGAGPGGHQLTLRLLSAGGRDLLLMTDTIGEENGVALLFSWPTHERAPVLQGPDGPVYAICPEEAPHPEEVIRLERALQELVGSDQPAAGPKQGLEA